MRAEPRARPGLLHGFSDDYFRRVEAVEFAVQHDDGANLHTLFRADLVLTGVSRTSKTPLSMYLAQRGYKTGNVPLVPGIEPPKALLDLDPRKVFALSVDPSHAADGAPGARARARRAALRDLRRSRGAARGAPPRAAPVPRAGLARRRHQRPRRRGERGAHHRALIGGE